MLLTAASVGYEFVKRSSDSIEIVTTAGTSQVWKLLLELPFDSTRKRMSVIVKQADESSDKNIYMFTKGADSAMIDFVNSPPEQKTIIKGKDSSKVSTFETICNRRTQNISTCEKDNEP